MQRQLTCLLKHWVALVCVCSVFWSVTTSARAESILLVCGERVPDELQEVVSDVLGDLGSVMSASSYTAKARGRGLEADSEQALTQLAPQAGAQLIVVLVQARGKVKVELRHGSSGEIVGRTRVPSRGKRVKLTKPAQKRLRAAAKRALAKIGRMPSKRRNDEVDGATFDANAPLSQTSEPTRPASPLPEQQEEEPEQEELAETWEEAPERDTEEAPPREESVAEGGMSVRLHAGVGLGTRSMVVPTPPGRGGNRIDTSFVPSLDLGAALELPLGPHWVTRIRAEYRTIFGLNAGYLSAPNTMATSSLSSHSFIGGASLGRLSDGRGSFGVHAFVGWAWRSLTAAEPSLPSAGIQGLVVRPELEIPIPIAKLQLALRLAPELILILVPTATLPANDNGLAKAVGFALGGEASLDLQITQTIGVSLQFRESRGTTPSGWGQAAIENERYLALRALLQF